MADSALARRTRQDDKAEVLPTAGTARHEALERRPQGPKPVQRAAPPNRTGLPDRLKAGVEALSGLAMDDVKVHYNSPRPAQLQAHAYAQGSEIHLAPGQEKHLPHEAWHVVQQKQGRVRATAQIKNGTPLNNDRSLEQEADAMGSRALSAGPWSTGLVARPAARGAGTQRTPVQRAGVKSELLAADANIEALTTESQKSRSLLVTVGDAIYEWYKPSGGPPQSLSGAGWGKTNRDKSTSGQRRDAARDGMTRLNHWAKTANESASRILVELTGIADLANVDLATIKMGMNTDREPDAFAKTQTGTDVALESKYISSPAQGAVDGHVVAASSQLQKRCDYQTKGLTKTKFGQYVAYLTITEPSNPWPYTPSAYEKSKATGFADRGKVMVERLQKYKDKSTAKVAVTYRIMMPDQSMHEHKI